MLMIAFLVSIFYHTYFQVSSSVKVLPVFFIFRTRQNAGIGRQPRKSELVYLEPSPSYCEPDLVTGALGTHGRQCNRTSRGMQRNIALNICFSHQSLLFSVK